MTTDRSTLFKLLDILENKPMTRREVLDAYIASLNFTKEQLMNKSTSGEVNLKRSIAGSALNDMLHRGIIIRSEDGLYTATEQRPVVIRAEKCEAEILNFLLKSGGATNKKIKNELIKIFGTDKTLTFRDDDKLSSTVSAILKRLRNDGILIYENNTYFLAERIETKIDDINGMLRLKEDFISSIYKNGGEFFEYYFMSLLEKYLTLHHKKVLSGTVTAGSADGGIDGIVETIDTLGFKETIMVQTKNRSEITSETDVRGFYGAVCAKQGSRGIYAITSSFHYGARNFLDGIDNCVGVDGNMIFKMAMETEYGIIRDGDKLRIDEKII